MKKSCPDLMFSDCWTASSRRDTKMWGYPHECRDATGMACGEHSRGVQPQIFDPIIQLPSKANSFRPKIAIGMSERGYLLGAGVASYQAEASQWTVPHTRLLRLCTAYSTRYVEPHWNLDHQRCSKGLGIYIIGGHKAVIGSSNLQLVRFWLADPGGTHVVSKPFRLNKLESGHTVPLA